MAQKGICHLRIKLDVSLKQTEASDARSLCHIWVNCSTTPAVTRCIIKYELFCPVVDFLRRCVRPNVCNVKRGPHDFDFDDVWIRQIDRVRVFSSAVYEQLHSLLYHRFRNIIAYIKLSSILKLKVVHWNISNFVITVNSKSIKAL